MARKESRRVITQDVELGVMDDRQRLIERDFSEDMTECQQFRHSLEHVYTPHGIRLQYCNKMSTAEHQVTPEVRPGVPDTPPGIARSNNRVKRMNTQLLEAIADRDLKQVERLLKSGASPNATCRLGHVTACHLATLTGGDAVELLLKFGAVNNRRDVYGRRPLHLAAWSGNLKEIGLLMKFPDGLRDKVDSGQTEEMQTLSPQPREIVNVQCDAAVLMELPETWVDSIVHDCGDMVDNLPVMEVGWTPLHAASANARPHCAGLLLASGADPHIRDLGGRTPLDVAGSAYYHGAKITAERFREVIETLLKTGGIFTRTFQLSKPFVSPLHVAMELENLDAIKDLLDAGASVSCLDRDGQTPLHICVKKQLRKHLQVLSNHDEADTIPDTPVVDVKDKDGHTVLHAAVKGGWLAGVRVALEAGADVTSLASDGQSPLHSAAALGDLVILGEVLNVAKQNNVLDHRNKWGETALFTAVVNGRLECLKKILNAGASIRKTEFTNKHILHEAASRGHFDILQVLLNYDDQTVEYMFKYKQDLFLWSPQHFAIMNNHIECFNILFLKHIDIQNLRKKTRYDASGLLFTAVEYNRFEIAKKIIEYDRMTVYSRKEALTPFKVALRHGSRDVLKLLLLYGISLSNWDVNVTLNGLNGSTAIHSIMYHLKKPTEFMQSIFDESMYMNECDFQDPSVRITVSYSIFMTKAKTEQMNVLVALLETGNEHGQRRLLLHPLVESFLYLKWMALSSVFYVIVFLTGLFVFCLNVFVISVFYYKDKGEPVPGFLDPTVWEFIVYATASLVAALECIHIIRKRNFSFKNVFKFTSITLTVAVPRIITMESLKEEEWPRHVATAALLNSWLDMMILLSHTPYWGYYVLMFRKVASKVVKILLTFLFVVIAFAFSFTIQFHSKKPFEDPWAAFFKTMVMMTSEFDYEDTFDQSNAKEISASILVWRMIFVFFLILIAIVLMNLMVGVAVTDLHNLVLKKKLKRLENQVIFLDSLEGLVNYKYLPNILTRGRYVNEILRIMLSEQDSYKHIPIHIIQAILKKVQGAQASKENKDGEIFITKLDEIHKVQIQNHDCLKSSVNTPDEVKTCGGDVVTEMNKKLDQISMDINVKMEQLSLEMSTMKQL